MTTSLNFFIICGAAMTTSLNPEMSSRPDLLQVLNMTDHTIFRAPSTHTAKKLSKYVKLRRWQLMETYMLC